ncbi:MAG: GHKL domain-containing protein [Flavobacteriales bacterium]|jgi:two-component system NtrC family sensor kinase|nr:GHKL domain-containing protein [Flavobacteriales bacterium]
MIRSLLLLPAFFVATMAWSQTEPVIKVSEGPYYVGKRLLLLTDSTERLGITDVTPSRSFVPIDQDVPNLGITSYSFWLKGTVLNDSQDGSVILDLEHAEVESIDLYVRSGDNVIQHIASTGQDAPLASRDIEDPAYVFSLPIPVDTKAEVFIRVRSGKQLQVPIKIHAPSTFSESRSTKNLLIGAYIGIMLVMALYNLFVFVSIRDKSYLIYVNYILFVTLTQLAFWGVGQFYLWHGSQWFSVKASIILTFLTAIAASEFMRHFIDTRSNAKGLDKTIPIFYMAFIVVIGIYAFLSPGLGYKIAQIAAGAFASFLYYTAFKVYRSGSRQAAYFLIAWSVFLLGTMVFTLKDMGILPYNSLTVFTMPLGSAIEGVLLSFGLADRINILRRDKERSQAETLSALQENERIIREQNVVLEQKVKQRTHALQESNDTLKRTQTQLVNSEKMASLGQLTAGIAHEINNPINFITSNVQPLRRNIRELVEVMQDYRSLDPKEAGERLKAIRAKEEALGIDESIAELDDIIDSIAEGSSRTADIVRGLRNFSRLDEDDLKNADLNEGLRSTLTVLAPQYRDKVTIELDLGTIPSVECYPGKLNQVFMNVITNAVQATVGRPGDRPRLVHVRTSTFEDRVRVIISDNGVGMTEDVRARLYDPFFTTKPVGEGTGLGMAIVYGIIQDHQGDIHVESSPGVGTVFTIDIPVRHQRAQMQRA